MRPVSCSPQSQRQLFKDREADALSLSIVLPLVVQSVIQFSWVVRQTCSKEGKNVNAGNNLFLTGSLQPRW